MEENLFCVQNGYFSQNAKLVDSYSGSVVVVVIVIDVRVTVPVP